MSVTILIATLLVLSAIGYWLGRARAISAASGGIERLNSLPGYYGYYVAIWCGLPALLLVAVLAGHRAAGDPRDRRRRPASRRRGTSIRRGSECCLTTSATWLWAASSAAPSMRIFRPRPIAIPQLNAIGLAAMSVAALAAAIAGLTYARRRIAPELRARAGVEATIKIALIVCSAVAIVTTVGIVLSLIFEAGRFFARVSPLEFLFGLEWSPQIALRADQVGAAGLFGAVPLFVGTLLISFIAMCVAMPVGLFAAIYTAEYAHPRARAMIKPVLEILAGVPTVVYGFFAALTVAPFFRNLGEGVGLQISSESALAAGIVMGVMIIPFVSSLSDDVITAVPQSMREGSYGLGGTQSETIRKVILPAALPGIVGGFLLAISRAIGETMIVVMAAGLAANLTANPLDAVTTVTVQIVTLLVGDQEFDSPKTLAAFALGLSPLLRDAGSQRHRPAHRKQVPRAV